MSSNAEKHVFLHFPKSNRRRLRWLHKTLMKNPAWPSPNADPLAGRSVWCVWLSPYPTSSRGPEERRNENRWRRKRKLQCSTGCLCVKCMLWPRGQDGTRFMKNLKMKKKCLYLLRYFPLKPETEMSLDVVWHWQRKFYPHFLNLQRCDVTETAVFLNKNRKAKSPVDAGTACSKLTTWGSSRGTHPAFNPVRTQYALHTATTAGVFVIVLLFTLSTVAFFSREHSWAYWQEQN